MQDATAAAHALLDAWNDRDLDRFIGLLTDDIEWYDPSMPRPPIRGKAAVREFTEATLEAFPDFRYDVDLPLCASADGSRCAIVWRISATHRRPLRPLGFAPTGRKVTMDGVDVLDVRDGKIFRIRTAFDAVAAAEQLLGIGLRPQPGSWRAAIAVAIQRVIARFTRV